MHFKGVQDLSPHAYIQTDGQTKVKSIYSLMLKCTKNKLPALWIIMHGVVLFVIPTLNIEIEVWGK